MLFFTKITKSFPIANKSIKNGKNFCIKTVKGQGRMREQKKVSAIVLAGGFGTRLCPLTDIKPKPLVKILDTTVLENTFCSITLAGIDDICVSTHYQSEKIERLCREKYPDVVCKCECVPLGTAGGVKFCTGTDAENVLVVSGDAVFDFPLEPVIDFHMKNDCDVTIVTCRKENPTEYGVVSTDDDNNIVEFFEKPSWKMVRSDLVNTGIYVLSKYALDNIPDNIQYDFSKNLFPKLMKEGRKIKSYTPQGFWCDVGTLDEYYECNVRAAGGKLSCIQNNGLKKRNLVEKGIHAENGVYVSPDSMIGKNVRITSGSVVCKNTHIGDNCDISSSIIGEDTRIGKGSSVSLAIIGAGTAVGENCIIPEGCIIGDESRISDGSVLKKNTRIASRACVNGKDEKMMFFSNSGNIFVDDGLVSLDIRQAHTEIPKLARALCVAYTKGEKAGVFVAVMCTENSSYIKNAFVSGLQCENANVFDCGTGNAAMCSYITSRLCVNAGVYIDASEERINISFFDAKGQKIDDDNERKISKALELAGEKENEKADLHAVPFFSSVPADEMYYAYLSVFAKNLAGIGGFEGQKLCFTGGEHESPLSRVFLQMHAEVVKASTKDTINVSINPDGTRATVRYGNIILDHEHICALILKNKDILGIEEMHVDENMPTVLRGMAAKNSRRNAEKTEDFISGDASLALIALMSAVAKRAERLSVLCEEIPLFEIYTDEYIGDVNRGETVRKLSRLYHDSPSHSGDGIRLSLADGNVTVIPNRAKGLKIVAEAQSMEAARELTIKIGDIIKGKE